MSSKEIASSIVYFNSDGSPVMTWDNPKIEFIKDFLLPQGKGIWEEIPRDLQIEILKDNRGSASHTISYFKQNQTPLAVDSTISMQFNTMDGHEVFLDSVLHSHYIQNTNRKSSLIKILSKKGESLVDPTMKKNNMHRNLEQVEKLLKTDREKFVEFFGDNIYGQVLLAGGSIELALLVGDKVLGKKASEITAENIDKNDFELIEKAVKSKTPTYPQVIFDHSDKSKRYYAKNAITITSLKDGYAQLKNIRLKVRADMEALMQKHNTTDFNAWEFLSIEQAHMIEQEVGTLFGPGQFRTKPGKGKVKTGKSPWGLMLDVFKTANDKSFASEEYHKDFARKRLLGGEGIKVSKKQLELTELASVNYTVNKFYLQGLYGNWYEGKDFTDKNKRNTLFSAPHVASFNEGRVEVVGFNDAKVTIDGKTKDVTDGGGYVTQAMADKLMQKHGIFTGVDGSFKIVGGGQNIDNKKMSQKFGDRSLYYMKGHVTILTEQEAKGSSLEGVYNALKAREERVGDEVMVVAYPSSVAKKGFRDGVNSLSLKEWSEMNADEVNSFQDSFSYDEPSGLYGYNGQNFGVQVEIDKEGKSATIAKQAISTVAAMLGIKDPAVKAKVLKALEFYVEHKNLKYEENLKDKPVKDAVLETLDSDVNSPILMHLNDKGFINNPAFDFVVEEIFSAIYKKERNKPRANGTQAIQKSDIAIGYDLEGKDIKVTKISKVSEVKKGTSELFKSNPELAKIGTIEEYSAFLETVFPNSKVKDVVYHGSPEFFNEFKKSKLGSYTGAASAKQGFFFASSREVSKSYLDKRGQTVQLKEYIKLKYGEDVYNKIVRGFNYVASGLAEKVLGYKPERVTPNNDLDDTYGIKLEDGSILYDNGDYNGSDPKGIFLRDYILRESHLESRHDTDAGAYINKDRGITDAPFESLFIKPFIINAENPSTTSDEGKTYREETYNERINKAKEEGNDSVIIEDTYDSKTQTKPEDVFMVFEPSQIYELGSEKDIQRFKDFVKAEQQSVTTIGELGKDFVATTDNNLRGFAEKLDPNNPGRYLPAEVIMSTKMAEKLGLQEGDVFIATRIPTTTASSQIAVVLKSTLDSNDNTIIAHQSVADIMGFDFDGDIFHINAKDSSVSDRAIGLTDRIDTTPSKIALNRYVDAMIELLTDVTVVDTILKQSVDFKNIQEKTIAELGLDKEGQLNDFVFEDTTKMFAQTKGNQDMIGIICATNSAMNHLGISNGKLSIASLTEGGKKELSDISITYKGKEYNSLSGDITANEISTIQKHGIWANLVLDDGKYGNRARFGFNEVTANAFVVLLRMGIAPEIVSKVMTNETVVEELQAAKDATAYNAWEFLQYNSKGDVSASLDNILTGDIADIESFAMMMTLLSKDMFNISQMADPTKMIKGGMLSTLNKYQRFRASLGNQKGLVSAFQNNPILLDNIESVKEYLRKSTTESISTNNGYAEKYLNYDEKFAKELGSSILFEDKNKSFQSQGTRGTRLNHTHEPLLKASLIKRALMHNTNSEFQISEIINSIITGKKEDGTPIFELYDVDAEEKYTIDSFYVDSEGNERTEFEQVSLLNKIFKDAYNGLQTTRFSRLVREDITEVEVDGNRIERVSYRVNESELALITTPEQITATSAEFNKLPKHIQDALLLVDLLDNGFGVTNKPIFILMGDRALSMVDGMFANLKDANVSNYDSDTNVKLNKDDGTVVPLMHVVVETEDPNTKRRIIKPTDVSGFINDKDRVQVTEADIQLQEERFNSVYLDIINRADKEFIEGSELFSIVYTTNDTTLDKFGKKVGEKGEVFTPYDYWKADKVVLIDKQYVGRNNAFRLKEGFYAPSYEFNLSSLRLYKLNAYQKLNDQKSTAKVDNNGQGIIAFQEKTIRTGNIKGVGIAMSEDEFGIYEGILPHGINRKADLDPNTQENIIARLEIEYQFYEQSINKVNDIYNEIKEGTQIEDVDYGVYNKDNKDASDRNFKSVEKDYIKAQDALVTNKVKLKFNQGNPKESVVERSIHRLASAPLQRYLEYHFGRHIAGKQISDWEIDNPNTTYIQEIAGRDGLNKDISALEMWASPGDFGRDKPTVGFINKIMREEHNKHIHNMNKVTKEMNNALDELFKLHYSGTVSRFLAKGAMKFSSIAGYSLSNKLFGNMVESVSYLQEFERPNEGTPYYKYQSETRLRQDLFKSETRKYTDEYGKVEEYQFYTGLDYKAIERAGLQDAEIKYLEMYVKYTGFFSSMVENQALYAGKSLRGANYVPALKSGRYETLMRRGLFGMYFRMKQGDVNLSNVRIKATNPLTGSVQTLSYNDWKSIFMHGPEEIIDAYTFDKTIGDYVLQSTGKGVKLSGKERILKFRAITKKAEQLYRRGEDDAGNKIEQQSDVNEDVDFNRHLTTRSGRSAFFATHNIHYALREYVKKMTFDYGNTYEAGDIRYRLVWDPKTQEMKVNDKKDESAERYNHKGFQEKKYLIDAATAFLRGDKFFKTEDMSKAANPNAVRFLNDVVKKAFIEGERGKTLTGFDTEAGAIKFFVNWTMYVALGFNIPAAIGNVAIGKYNTYRQRGGKEVLKGEMRYFGVGKDGRYSHNDFRKGRAMMNEFGILTYQASELAEGVGGSSIGNLIFFPMVTAENWIQRAAFLGSLTQEQWDAYTIDEKTGDLKFVGDAEHEITPDVYRKLEREVTSVQGRGYSEIEQRLAQTYALGSMAMQFKRWFPTFIADRFKKEHIDDLGTMRIGTMTAAADFIKRMRDEKIATGSKEWFSEYNKLEKHRKDAIVKLIRGTKGIALISLLLALVKGFGDDDDENTKAGATFLEKLLGDVLLIANVPRLTYMANIPALKTFENLSLATYNLAVQSEYQRKSKYGRKGDLRYQSYLAQLMPKVIRKPLLGQKDSKKRKIR